MFNVGDVIERIDGQYERMYRILEVARHDLYGVEVIRSDQYLPGTVIPRRIIQCNLFRLVNANAITVSSLDYMTNKDLSDEDKEIINAHIQGG